MCSRRTDSSSLTLPGFPGPDDQPAYSTRDWQELLELHERALRQGRLKARRQAAHAAGRRPGTITARSYPSGRVPYIRLSGRWLRAAGFNPGQAFEVEVRAGELVIQAV